VVDFLSINSSSSSPFEFPTYPIDHFRNYITCGPLNSICQDVRILNGDKNLITQASNGGFPQLHNTLCSAGTLTDTELSGPSSNPS
jgi:hypothetical protein